jgi:hypothetical protein
MRFYFRYELEHLLSKTRFSAWKIYGDYFGNELNPESKDFVVVLSK